VVEAFFASGERDGEDRCANGKEGIGLSARDSGRSSRGPEKLEEVSSEAQGKLLERSITFSQ